MTSNAERVKSKDRQLLVFAALLAGILSLLFFRSFDPTEVVFSNDGPYGGMVAQHNRMPALLTGYWQDLNWLGYEIPAPSPTISTALRLVTTPLGFSKWFCPFALFILGLCAWFCFRQWKLAPLACILGGLAAALSSHFLSTAGWGVASQVITVGMSFVAVGLLSSDSGARSWLLAVLAGMAVGIGIMEGYDIGAIFSLYVAAFGLYRALIAEGPTARKLTFGVLRVAVVAIFAAFLATQVVVALVGTQIKGISGTEQTTEAKAQRWDFATQWSLPPSEVPGILVPGLFGYRMDTPKNMVAFQDAFEGGAYWGEVGRDPNWDRYFAAGKQGPPPQGSLRFSGGGEYAGVLVVVVALWAVAQSMRKKDSVFGLTQRKMIWFWAIAAFVSLLFAFGRYAPFYRFVYMLPYFSTIRNPSKFTHPFHWALVILFAYGVHGLSRRYLESASATAKGLSEQLKSWWAKASLFDRRWVKGCSAALAAGLLSWMIYGSSSGRMESHLEETGFSDPATAGRIVSFSVHSLGWSILILALAIGLVLLVLSGWFGGKRARTGAILLGLFLVVDLGRADLPWIIYWDYPQKYASNPIIDLLREKPHEHRVAIFPLERFMNFSKLPPEARPLVEPYFPLFNLYHIEWKQQHFQYYNIQSLDVVQMPREPVDYKAFETAMAVAPLRRWQLTNTRYLLGPTALLSTLNNQFDPAKRRFRVAEAFDIVPRSGFVNTGQPDEQTAVINTNGALALFEFTGALSRAKLYSNWQTETNDQVALTNLASPSFDPENTVLVASSLPPSAKGDNSSTNQNAGAVEIRTYAPKRVAIHAKADAPAVLLLNDKYDANWKVSVDGKPETLLRCNYIMRGVQVPKGEHDIEFRFAPPITGLYVSLAAIALGLGLVGFLAISKPEEQSSETKTTPRMAESAPVRK